jgi:hypothetical protein
MAVIMYVYCSTVIYVGCDDWMGKKLTEQIKEERFVLRFYRNVDAWFSELLFLLCDILYFRQLFLLFQKYLRIRLTVIPSMTTLRHDQNHL